MAVDSTGFRSLVEQIQQRDRAGGDREDGRERPRRPAPAVAKAAPAPQTEAAPAASARDVPPGTGATTLLQRRWL